MLKKLFTMSLLGMLCCTSLVIGSDQSNLGNGSTQGWEEFAVDATARHRSGRHRRCRPALPKTNAADGVRLQYYDSAESPIYQREYKFLLPFVDSLTALLFANTDQAHYANLLAAAQSIVNNYNAKFGITSARVVITDQDGLVIVDTDKNNNTFANAQAGASPATFSTTINVNHNSRLSILDAQQYFAGVGFETKFSNSVGVFQIYTAIRLGPILKSAGTVRLSQNAP